MYDVHERRPEDEEEIVIEDDVWIGTRVIILKGVRVGRGCVIAAGTILTRSVPPYSIVGGVPGKVIRQRWTHDEILMHEKVLYPEGQRLAFASEEKASK
jgi:acetyltransferase-like isoleucine patch superfamily enzyme